MRHHPQQHNHIACRTSAGPGGSGAAKRAPTPHLPSQGEADTTVISAPARAIVRGMASEDWMVFLDSLSAPDEGKLPEGEVTGDLVALVQHKDQTATMCVPGWVRGQPVLKTRPGAFLRPLSRRRVRTAVPAGRQRLAAQHPPHHQGAGVPDGAPGETSQAQWTLDELLAAARPTLAELAVSRPLGVRVCRARRSASSVRHVRRRGPGRAGQREAAPNLPPGVNGP